MSRYTFSLIRRFISDLYYCTRLMEKPFCSYGYLRSGQEPLVGFFNYGHIQFKARKEDWLAIREVIINDEYNCIEQLFPSNATPRILDIGANIGSFALRVFHHCPSAQVVSVEAADDTFQILETNQRVNASLRWRVLNYGVWGNDETLKLMRRGISMGHRVTADCGDEVVQGISLSTLCEKLSWDKVDLIKMDIEGGEESVIPASLDVLRDTRVLIIEIHNDRIDSGPVMSALRSAFSYQWQLNDRKSGKPLYLMSNEMLELGDGAWRVNE